jgi:hypothetical protein
MPLLLALAALLAGCQREEVQVYAVEKEARPKPPPADPHAGHGHRDSATRPQLDYTLPAGWTVQAPSAMRAASFAIAGPEGQTADVAIVPLAGMTGRDLDMVNLWRGQVRLEPIQPDELHRVTTQTPIGPEQGKLFDMASAAPLDGGQWPLRVLVAMLERDGTAWFFKMTGPDSLVQAQRPAFLDFLKTVTFRNDAGMTSPHGGMPAAHETAAASASDKPHWTVPAGWQETPGGQFLIAKFNLTGEAGATAAVNVSMSTGEGGGWIGNVNRWRGQLGLGELTPAELSAATTALELPGGKAMLVDLLGTDARTGQPARVLGAMVPQPGRAWFYKLMGHPTLVDSQRDAFATFVQSAKY